MQWWSEYEQRDKPWLLLGKGPTFARRDEFDLSGFNTVSINHVIRELQVDIASVIDLDVLRDCGDDIVCNARFLLVPRYPHPHPDLGQQVPTRPIESFYDELPFLRQLENENRLIWYYLQTSPQPHATDSPIIPTGNFSAEVLVNLLSHLGVKKIRTLGVDGGSAYATQFNHLEEKRLANGQLSFDVQTRGIMKTVHKNAIDFAPLTDQEPMRVYVGADESQMLGARVLEYSIRRFCTAPLVFDTMQNVQLPMPRDPKNQPRTQFSFNRFAIPHLAGYTGRAVYVDADMQVFRDFRELYNLPFGNATILYAPSSDSARVKQFSVLLLDCDKLKWDPTKIVQGFDEGLYDYDALMKEMCIEPETAIQPTIPPQWNSLENYVEGETGLIHYTDMHTQPWVNARNKNGDLWVACLRDAIRDGFISQAETRQAVKDGFARPSLWWQLKLPRRLWPLFNATIARVLDVAFRPHRALQKRLAAAKKQR